MKYFALLCVLTVSLFGFNANAADLEIMNAYAYATTQVQKNGAVFMDIKNNSDQDDKVLSASSSVAQNVELHTHTMDGDMMMMREVEFYDVPAGGKTTLEPMGHHIMLMGLTNKLNVGEEFPLVLEFEKHGTQDVTVKILNPGEQP